MDCLRLDVDNHALMNIDPRGPRGSAPTPRKTDPGHRDLSSDNTAGLLRLYGDILVELRRRGVTRSENSPVGDVAEALAARAFGLTLETNSSVGYDGTDHKGIRYQVKGRRLTHWNPFRQLGAIRGLEAGSGDPFALLVGILFDPDMTVRRAALVPIGVIRARAARQDHVKAWRFMLTDEVWTLAGVVDVTEAIRIAATGL